MGLRCFGCFYSKGVSKILSIVWVFCFNGGWGVKVGLGIDIEMVGDIC